MQIDLNAMNLIHSALIKAAYNNVVNVFFSENINSHFENKDTDIEAERLSLSWYCLNEISYICRYNIPAKDTGYFINFKNWVEPEPCKLLKLLNFLDYNIEIETIRENLILSEKQQNDHVLLLSWINDIKNAIINDLPEYKNAKWGEI